MKVNEANHQSVGIYSFYYEFIFIYIKILLLFIRVCQFNSNILIQ